MIDEQHILDTLGADAKTPDAETAAQRNTRLQVGAILALVDAYDRKLTRDQFIIVASLALTIHTTSGKGAMLQSTHELFRTEELTEASFLTAATAIDGVLKTKTNELCEIVKRMAMCPVPGDKVH